VRVLAPFGVKKLRWRGAFSDGEICPEGGIWDSISVPFVDGGFVLLVEPLPVYVRLVVWYEGARVTREDKLPQSDEQEVKEPTSNISVCIASSDRLLQVGNSAGVFPLEVGCSGLR